jgi:hypothetical protein
MRSCLGWESDPGPCPVDDTPHTACTSPDYAAGSRRQVVTVPLRRPRALVLETAVTPPVIDTPRPVEVSTKNYRRATHGLHRKRGDTP